MSALIEEFWIFSKSGLPLVHFERNHDAGREFDYNIPELEETILQKIKEIIQYQSKSKKSNKIALFKEPEFNVAQCLENDSIIFYKTSNDAKEKNIKKVCEIIGNIFEETYKFNQLKFIDENMDIFKKFQNKLAIYSKLSTL